MDWRRRRKRCKWDKKKNISNQKEMNNLPESFTTVAANSSWIHSNGIHLQNQQNITFRKQNENPQCYTLFPDLKAVSEDNSHHIYNASKRPPQEDLRGSWNQCYGLQLRNFSEKLSTEIVLPVFNRLSPTFEGISWLPKFQNVMRPFRFGSNSISQARSDFSSMPSSSTRCMTNSVAVLFPNNFKLSNKYSSCNSTVNSTSSIQRNATKLRNMNNNNNQFGGYNVPSTSSSAIPVVRLDGRNQEIIDDDDVTYLFTVDSAPYVQIVEEIDLHSESESVNFISVGGSKVPTNLSQISETNNIARPSLPHQSNNSNSTVKAVSPKAQKNRKRKASNKNENSSTKRSNKDIFQLRCSVCDVHYDEMTGIEVCMCISTNCGHLFCDSCIRKSIRNCPKCNKTLQRFRKLFL